MSIAKCSSIDIIIPYHERKNSPERKTSFFIWIMDLLLFFYVFSIAYWLSLQCRS